MEQSHYLVVNGSMTHLGDKPTFIMGLGEFIGKLYFAKFDLPENMNPNEKAIMQYRIVHNNETSKKFFLNERLIGNFTENTLENRDICIMDVLVIPEKSLVPGENNIHIGCTHSSTDGNVDFAVDDIIIWYKTV